MMIRQLLVRLFEKEQAVVRWRKAERRTEFKSKGHRGSGGGGETACEKDEEDGENAEKVPVLLPNLQSRWYSSMPFQTCWYCWPNFFFLLTSFFSSFFSFPPCILISTMTIVLSILLSSLFFIFILF